MGTIKLKRGTGSPAGSLAQFEVAMDVADKTLYTSSDGSDAVIIGNNTEYFLANNTISALATTRLTNTTTIFDDVIFAIRQNTANNFVLTAAQITRDLGSDGAVAAKEDRTASLDFSVQSDATNTNNSPQNIYAGGIYGGSGSNDGSSPNFLACFAYDDGITSFSKPVIWEGTKDQFEINPRIKANDGMDIEDPDADLNDAVINIKVDQSGYNRAQLMLEDSNGKAFSMVGEMDNVNQMRDKFIVTLDPDNVNSPDNINTYAGDYGIYYLKEYGTINNPAIEMNVFGAKDGFKLRVYDDNNSSSPNPGPLGYGGYGWKPFEAHCENFQVYAKSSDTATSRVLEVDIAEAIFEVPIRNANLSADPANPVNGWQYYNTTTHKLRLYADGAWVNLN